MLFYSTLLSKPCQAPAQEAGTSCEKLVIAVVATGTSSCQAPAQEAGTTCEKLVIAVVTIGTSPCQAPAQEIYQKVLFIYFCLSTLHFVAKITWISAPSPSLSGRSTYNGLCLVSLPDMLHVCTQKRNIYRCTRTSRDRLGL